MSQDDKIDITEETVLEAGSMQIARPTTTTAWKQHKIQHSLNAEDNGLNNNQ